MNQHPHATAIASARPATFGISRDAASSRVHSPRGDARPEETSPPLENRVRGSCRACSRRHPARRRRSRSREEPEGANTGDKKNENIVRFVRDSRDWSRGCPAGSNEPPPTQKSHRAKVGAVLGGRGRWSHQGLSSAQLGLAWLGLGRASSLFFMGSTCQGTCSQRLATTRQPSTLSPAWAIGRPHPRSRPVLEPQRVREAGPLDPRGSIACPATGTTRGCRRPSQLAPPLSMRQGRKPLPHSLGRSSAADAANLRCTDQRERWS